MARIDKQVVEMEFKNQQFEQGAKQTVGTLEKLKEALKFDKADEGFNNISRAAKNVDLSSISRSIEDIKNRFSTLGIVGMTVVSNLTTSAMNFTKKIFTQMYSGGLQRALNIEQAKFMFEGLGMDIEASMASANAAVKGTAYGLDSAAKAASQLGASGMRAGDDMTSALRGIAGVAAMTGSSYDDIARIFTTVAGNGRLMSEQLLQFSARGINAAAALAQQMNMSEEEIRDMVSKGKISFEDFYKAMDNAFGTHAKDANKTFNGALSNMKAALNRIGADIATPALKNLRDVFNSLTPVIDKIHEALNPLIGDITEVMSKMSGFAVGVINNLDITPIANGIENFRIIANSVVKFLTSGFIALGKILKPIGQAFNNIFPPMTNDKAAKLADIIEKLGEKIQITDERVEAIRSTFESIFSVFKNVSTIVGKLVVGFSQLIFGLFDKIVSLDIGTKIADMFSKISTAISNFLADGVDLSGFADTFRTVFGAGVFAAIGAQLVKFTSILPKISESLSNFLDGKGQNKVTSLLNNITDSLENLQNTLNAATLISIAVSIGILALAIDKLSNIQFGDLAKSLTAMVVMFNILSGSLRTFLIVMEGSTVDGIFKTAAAMTVLSAAILILSYSVERLGQMDLAQLAKGLGAVGIAILELAAFTKLANFNGIKSTPILSLAIAITILGAALKIIDSIDVEGLKKSIVGVGFVLLEIASFSELMSRITAVGKSAGALLIVSSALVILGAALKIFSTMSLEQIGVGLIGMSGGLAAISIALSLMSNPGILTGAAAMLVCSNAILALTPAIMILSSLSIEGLAIAMAALAGTFVIFGLAGFALQPVTPVILALSAAIAMFGSGVLMIGAGVLALATGLNVLGAAFASLGSGAMIGITALVSLIPMVFEQIGIGIVKLLESITNSAIAIVNSVKTIILSVCQAITESIPTIVSAVVTMVVSVCDGIIQMAPKIIETGLFLLTTFLQGIADNIFQITVLVGQIITEFINGLALQLPIMIQAGFNFMLSFINGLADAIRTNIPLVLQAVWNLATSIIDGLFNTITGGTGSITQAFGDLIQNGLIHIASFLGEFIVKGHEFVMNIVQGVQEFIGNLIATISNMVITVISTIGSFLGQFLTKGIEFIANIINGVTQKAGELITSIGTAIQDAVNKVGEFVGQFIQAGANIIGGLIEGIKRKASEIIGAITAPIGGAIEAAKNMLQINSPSKVFASFGRSIDEGLALGIKQDSRIPINESKKLTDSVISKASKAISEGMDHITRSMNLSPVITPVLNSRNFESGMRNMLSSKNISFMSSTRFARKAFSSMNPSDVTVPVSDVTDSSQSSGAVWQFIQNNYSPKALSNAEIYRNTKNQFARAREVVKRRK